MTGNPEITIGLVTLNEERTIGEALQAALGELNSVNGELIVVAGGTDRTVQIVRETIAGRGSVRMVEDASPRGKPAALNRLFSQAKGDIVVLSDGDVLIRKGSVKLLNDAFKNGEVGCASGRVVGKPGDYNPIQKACNLMTEMMHLSRQRNHESSATIELASGYLLAIRRGLAPNVPEDASSDDGFISLSVRSNGKKISYVDGAVVAIGFPRTMTDFLRQKTRTRYGHLQLRSQFPSSHARGAGTEVGEFRSMGKVRKELAYGPQISLLAVLLTSLTWACAYIRFHIPWAFRRRIWQPIPSTK